MKAFQRIFLLFAVVCFILSAASFASSINERASEPVAATDSSYILKCDGEAICVYSDSACTERIGVLDICVSDLPPEDRQLLECGLLIENEQQLLSLIEDYTG